jgi:hypothetical protein
LSRRHPDRDLPRPTPPSPESLRKQQAEPEEWNLQDLISRQWTPESLAAAEVARQALEKFKRKP